MIKTQIHKLVQAGKDFGLRIFRGMNLLEVLFLTFCMVPFLFPIPVVRTDVQPYAAILATAVIVSSFFIHKEEGNKNWKTFVKQNPFAVVALFTLLSAVGVLIFDGIHINGLRAFYNYYALAVIPWAVGIVLRRIGRFPEELIKGLILIWFFVASVQYFIYGGFATQIISGARWDSDGWRGVLGLASEPSFFGIACFYFLHLIRHFEKHQLFYTAIVLVMGFLYAQSAMGIIFIVPLLLICATEGNRKIFRIPVWVIFLALAVGFLIVLNTVFVGTRLHSLFQMLVTGGFGGVLEDTSVSVRFYAIVRALKNAFSNFLLPMGFGRRIGSGYGGFLCELGFLALPMLFSISGAMSLTFRGKVARVIYFFVVTILLLNNTQLGNPLLLLVIGSNLYNRNPLGKPNEN